MALRQQVSNAKVTAQSFAGDCPLFWKAIDPLPGPLPDKFLSCTFLATLASHCRRRVSDGEPRTVRIQSSGPQDRGFGIYSA